MKSLAKHFRDIAMLQNEPGDSMRIEFALRVGAKTAIEHLIAGLGSYGSLNKGALQAVADDLDAGMASDDQPGDEDDEPLAAVPVAAPAAAEAVGPVVDLADPL